MRNCTQYLFAIVSLCVVSASATACDSAIVPETQSLVRFYDKDFFGRLGVVNNNGNFVSILDTNRCYDLSFLRNKFLSIYFNNARDDDNAEPTYVGALIVRVFRTGQYQEGPFSAYLFRSSALIARSSSKWAHASVEPGNAAPATNFKMLADELNSEEPIVASDFSGLARRLRFGLAETETRLREWHALVVAPKDDGIFVFRDTSKSDSSWTVDPKIKDRLGSYLIARSYLIKYQTNLYPRAEPYFQSGAAAADCVYIKVIGPADDSSGFALGGGGFISLKMKNDAMCVDPS